MSELQPPVGSPPGPRPLLQGPVTPMRLDSVTTTSDFSERVHIPSRSFSQVGAVFFPLSQQGKQLPVYHHHP